MSESATQRLVRESNELAAKSKSRPGLPSVTVFAIKDGVYNGPDHKSLGQIMAGTVFATAPNYAELLVKGGSVRYAEDNSEVAKEDMEEITNTEQTPLPDPVIEKPQPVPKGKKRSTAE
jgi:hypothetical protein